MLKSGLCSINRGKGFAVLILMALLAVTLISLWAMSHGIMPSQVGVNWGSIKSPACPPGQVNCGETAVEWGSKKSPACQRSNVNCDNEATDWESIEAPTCPLDNPNCNSKKVAEGPSVYPLEDRIAPIKLSVDWGS